YYTSTTPSDASNRPGLGAVLKDPYGRIMPNGLTLTQDQFFCIGDNSRMSQDGRFFGEPNAWVEKRMSSPRGIVPRKLMMGRAFFVYFPAPYRWRPDQPIAP